MKLMFVSRVQTRRAEVFVTIQRYDIAAGDSLGRPIKELPHAIWLTFVRWMNSVHRALEIFS